MKGGILPILYVKGIDRYTIERSRYESEWLELSGYFRNLR